MAEAAATTVERPNEHPQSTVDAVSLAMIREAKRVKDKKQGELRSAYKTADLRGLDTDAAKIAIKLVEGGTEAIDNYFMQFRRVGEYIGLMGKTLAPAQYEMFGPKLGPVPEEERATKEGRSAGFDLDPDMSEKKIPYDPNSSKGQAWLAAFRQARIERDSVMAMQPPKVEPDPDDEGEDED